MSAHDVGVLAIAALTLVLTAVWSIRDQRAWASRRAAQLVAGLVCGVVAALAVAVPFVDLVPDAEGGLVAVGGVAVVAIVGVGVALVAPRRAGDQVPRSRRSPGARRAARSRVHSGP